jgi:hypothetical protein
VSEHPHAGRIAAVGYLSDALASVQRAWEALAKDGIEHTDDSFSIARSDLRMLADEAIGPCEVDNVLQTVEEMIEARGPAPVDHALRVHLVTAIVDARQAAKADEDRVCSVCGDESYVITDGQRYCPRCDPNREPSDDELANGHGQEGGIATGPDSTGGEER